MVDYAERVGRLRRAKMSVLAGLLAACPPKPGEPGYGQRNDANESLVYTRQLEYVEAEAARQPFPELKGQRLIPLKTDLPDAVTTYTVRMISSYGSMDWIGSSADDLPNVGHTGKEISVPIKDFGGHYKHSILEMRRARLLGIQLESENAEAAERARQQFIDRTLAFGDANLGIPGFVNQSGVTAWGASDITGDWPNATGAQILADMEKMIRYIPDLTDDMFPEETLTFLLPSNLMTTVLDKTVVVGGGVGEVSVWERIKQKHPTVTFESWNKLKTAGAGGTPRAVIYVNRKDVVIGVADDDVETTPPQAVGINIKVFLLGRCGGVMVKNLAGMLYVDDLIDVTP